jgi:hypothetical protein
MRPHGTWAGTSKRTLASAGLAAAIALAVPLAAPASTHSTGSAVAGAAATGVAFGGLTAQGWPVVVELSKNGRRVVRASTGLRLNCTSGGFYNVPDRYARLPVSKSRKFSFKFGPTTERNADGTTTDFEGSISGSINKARSKASGRWNLKLTERDAAGTVTDTCDSGSVSWSAKQ